jgi:hypothetical protein
MICEYSISRPMPTYYNCFTDVTYEAGSVLCGYVSSPAFRPRLPIHLVLSIRIMESAGAALD